MLLRPAVKLGPEMLDVALHIRQEASHRSPHDPPISDSSHNHFFYLLFLLLLLFLILSILPYVSILGRVSVLLTTTHDLVDPIQEEPSRCTAQSR